MRDIIAACTFDIPGAAATAPAASHDQQVVAACGSEYR